MTIDKKIKLKRLRAYGIGLFAAIVVYIIIYPIWVPYSAVIGMGISFSVLVLVYNYFIRTKYFLIWFRKFNQDYKHSYRFTHVLDIACRDLCIPITIQDSSFKRSYTGILSKWLWIYILFGGFILAVWAVLSIIIIYILIIILFPGSGPSYEGQILVLPICIVGFIASVLIIISIFYKFRERLDLRGFYSLDIETGIHKAGRILSKIIRRLFVYHGILVMQCPDAVWKQIVEFVLGSANVVLIDVSEPTESLLWELETSLRNKPKHSIVIACGIRKNEPEQLPKEVHEAVLHITGESDLGGLKVFYYPAEKPSFLFGETRAYNSAAKRFREEVGSLFSTQ
jgi:hypothetical protein